MCQWPCQRSSRWQLKFKVSAHQEEISDRQGPQDHRLWNVFCFCCTFICLLLLSSSGVWHGVNRCGEIPTACNVVCLSHGNIPFYWAFFTCGLLWRWFLLRLYCLIDNNNASLNRIFMRKNKTRKRYTARTYEFLLRSRIDCGSS